MPDQDQPHPRHHLLIAGTGRAGTSFLVRWLAAAGLKTHLATHDTPVWDDDANAGLEDLPIVADWKSAPYVMKSPWLVEVIDDVLANPRIVLDAVIIPVRDLTESAASRVVQELQSAHRKNPWLSGLTRSFEQWGTTPGGVVYSLDPVDQARLLAVSFHRLVQRLVRADIPIVLLDFPRLALDAEYLFGKLRRFVPATAAQAIEAHAALSDPDKIRVGRELAAAQPDTAPDSSCEAPDRLDAVALRREVRRLAEALAEAEHAAAAQQDAAAALRSALDVQAIDLAGLAPASSDADPQASQAQIATLIATVEQRRAEAEHAATAQQEAVAGLRCALEAQAAELTALLARLETRDAAQQAAQAQVATLTAAAEQWRAEAERVAAERQEAVAAMQTALEARDAELARLTAALDSRDANLARLTTTLEARDSELEAAQVRVAMLTGAAEQLQAEAGNAALRHQTELDDLRNVLKARDANLARLTATLEARDSDLEAAQERIAMLAGATEQVRAEAENAALRHQTEIAELRNVLKARDADLTVAQDLIATLTAAAVQQRAAAEQAVLDHEAAVGVWRDALESKAAELAGLATALAAAQAQFAALTEAAGHAAAAQQATVADLRSALDTKAEDAARLTATLSARDAELAVAQAQIAALTVMQAQARQEHAAVLASWTWRAGQPLRLAGHAARSVVTALRPARPPV